MVSIKTPDCEVVDDRPNVWEPFMQWVCLANVPRDDEFMFRCALVGGVAIVDLHGDKTTGPPLPPGRELVSCIGKTQRVSLCISGKPHCRTTATSQFRRHLIPIVKYITRIHWVEVSVIVARD